MPWKNSNNIDNGVTIDLGQMNSTTLNKGNATVSIQPGARWGNVYNTLQRIGYTVAGGRAFDVGVGGFVMGGGNNFYANRYGFGIDNVQNYEIVLASGCVHFLTIKLSC
jgi:FAD/FMN-containing dehydrogenase